jgi:4-amino-4-deoxy-L-arabinose transferase-like glycosyltransferase
MPNLRYAIFGGILLMYLAAGLLYATLTPPWQAPDEPAHYNYIRYLATQAAFPELVAACYDQAYLNELTSRHFPPELPVDNICYEFHQPPLYYILATPVYLLSRGSLLILRLLSVILGAAIVSLTFFMSQIIFPGNFTIACGAAAFVAFVPMHVAMLSSVNNDPLAELILAVILFLLVHRLASIKTAMYGIKQPYAPMTPASFDTAAPTQDAGVIAASTGQDLLLGISLGLGLLTKTTVYIAIPLIAFTLWSVETNHKGAGKSGVWRSWLKRAVVIYGLALAIALPWFIRNANLYGNFDILGLRRHEAIVAGQLRAADFLADVGPLAYLNNFIVTTFHSYWGQFGWMAVPMDSRTYLLLTILTLMALGGLLAWLTSDISRSEFYVPWPAVSLMALTILLTALGYGWYNLTFVQFQGRYLFPALLPLSLFFAIGLPEALSQRRLWWVAGGLVLTLAWLVIASRLEGGLDKWAILIIGLALAWLVTSHQLARRWPVSTTWFLIACYAGLAFLTLVSPFWFIRPYL